MTALEFGNFIADFSIFCRESLIAANAEGLGALTAFSLGILTFFQLLIVAFTSNVKLKHYFLIMVLTLIINFLIDVLALLIVIQLGAGGFCILGLIYIIVKGYSCSDREQPSAFGVYYSIKNYFQKINHRDEELLRYNKIYNEFKRKTIWDIQ